MPQCLQMTCSPPATPPSNPPRPMYKAPTKMKARWICGWCPDSTCRGLGRAVRTLTENLPLRPQGVDSCAVSGSSVGQRIAGRADNIVMLLLLAKD